MNPTEEGGKTPEDLESHSSLNHLTSLGVRNRPQPVSPRINSERPEEVHTPTVYCRKNMGGYTQREAESWPQPWQQKPRTMQSGFSWNHLRALQRLNPVLPHPHTDGRALFQPHGPQHFQQHFQTLTCSVNCPLYSLPTGVQTEPEQCYS